MMTDKKKPDTFNRARGEIMHYVLEFCLTKYWPNTTSTVKYSPGLTGFVPSGYQSTEQVQVGDLVVLSSTRVWSKWQIGWLVEIDLDTQPGWPRYLIRSLEDASLCWWENVGLNYFPRDKLADKKSWRWNDKQFAFKDRWFNVCYKEKDAYIVLPLYPEFGEGFQVTLGTRTRFGFDEITPSRVFPDWRKVTKAMMAECYDECVAEREAAKAEAA